MREIWSEKNSGGGRTRAREWAHQPGDCLRSTAWKKSRERQRKDRVRNRGSESSGGRREERESVRKIWSEKNSGGGRARAREWAHQPGHRLRHVGDRAKQSL